MTTGQKIQNLAQLQFAVFCIENIAIHLGVKADKVYNALAEKSDILSSYIIPSYDVLHTQSREFIVDDILRLMEEKGVRV